MPSFVAARTANREQRLREVHALCLLLCLEHQLGGEKTMFLRHRGVGTIDHVRDERGTVRQGHVLAVDVARFLLIDDEQVTLAWLACDVDVLADLDEPIGAENRQPSVAPRRETAWRKPVDADITRTLIAAKRDIAKVLERRVLWMMDVPYLRRNNVGTC